MSNYVNIANSSINLGTIINNNPTNLVSLVSTTNSILAFIGGTSNTCIISGISNPISSTDVANKNYVDSSVSNISFVPQTAVTQLSTDNSTNIATTAFVKSLLSGISSTPLYSNTYTDDWDAATNGIAQYQAYRKTGTPTVLSVRTLPGPSGILYNSTNFATTDSGRINYSSSNLIAGDYVTFGFSGSFISNYTANKPFSVCIRLLNPSAFSISFNTASLQLDPRGASLATQTFFQNTWGKWSFKTVDATLLALERATINSTNYGYIQIIGTTNTLLLNLYNSSKTLVQAYGPLTITLTTGVLPFQFNNTFSVGCTLQKGLLWDPSGSGATPTLFDTIFGA